MGLGGGYVVDGASVGVGCAIDGGLVGGGGVDGGSMGGCVVDDWVKFLCWEFVWDLGWVSMPGVLGLHGGDEGNERLRERGRERN